MVREFDTGRAKHNKINKFLNKTEYELCHVLILYDSMTANTQEILCLNNILLSKFGIGP